MARILTTGFELGEIIEHNGSISGNISSLYITSTVKRTGNYSMYSTAPANVSPGRYTLFSHYPPNATDKIYLRMAFRHNGMDSTKTGFVAIFSLRKGVNHQVGLGIEPSTHKIVVTRGGSEALGINSAVIARGQRILTKDVWFVIETYFYAHPTSGEIVVLVDGITDIAFSGNTAPNGNDYDQIQIGASSIASAHTEFYFDDIGINDASGTVQNSWVGKGGVYLLKPNSDIIKQWTPSAGDTHYILVDDIPKNTTDYISAQNSGTKDIFGFTDVPVEVTAIDLIEIVFQASLAQSGYNEIAPIIKLASEYVGDSHPVTSVHPSYVLYKNIYYQNPETGTGWQIDDINNLQAGVIIP